jgi:hypothetical protein
MAGSLNVFEWIPRYDDFAATPGISGKRGCQESYEARDSRGEVMLLAV